MIRLATASDKLRLVDLLNQFYEESGYEFVTGISKFERNYEEYIKHPEAVFLVSEQEGRVVGFIFGAVATSIFSDDLVATELAWFMEKRSRGSSDSLRLVKAYEYWAKSVGAKFCSLACLNNIRDLSKVYEKLGYVPSEKVYVRKL
jgi:GNAT superfamily N-acetyltransferase